MLLAGRALIGSLHDRVGDQSASDVSSAVVGGPDPAVWARMLGESGKQSGSGLSGSGPAYDYHLAGVQIGAHLYGDGAANMSHSDAGIFASFAQLTSDVTHVGVLTGAIHAGTNRFNTGSFAGYWTYYGADGAYADAVLQGTWYTAARATPSDSEERLSTRASAVAASWEGGWRNYVLSPTFSWQPQAQVIYQHMRVDSAGNDFETVQFGAVNSLAARIGARIATTPNANHPLSLWIAINAWHEFLARPRTTYPTDDGDVSFRSDLKGNWWEFKLGAQGNVWRNLSMYASVYYDAGGNSGLRNVGGTLGMMLRW